MSAPTANELYLVVNSLIVLAIGYSLVKFTWNLPLKHGPGYFQGVEVPADFYEGPGRNWLKGYHTILIALHTALAAALVACFALRRLDWSPIFLGGWALLYTAAMQGFSLFTRSRLGANPPVRPVALALESRRLGDYIWWPQEALAGVIIVFSWWLLLTCGVARPVWLTALQLTWGAMVLPGKIALVRSSFPIPAERIEEHYRFQDAKRRNSISVLTAWSWFFVVVLLGTTLRHTWAPAWTVPGFQWLIVAAFLAAWAYYMLVMFRGQRLAAMGRDLRPAGSFQTPYRRTIWASRLYLSWFVPWFVVLMILVSFSLFR
jgi:hypothetical protein